MDFRNIVATSVLLRKRLTGGHRDFLGSNLFPGAVIGAAHSLVLGFFHLLTSQDSFLLALFKNFSPGFLFSEISLKYWCPQALQTSPPSLHPLH